MTLTKRITSGVMALTGAVSSMFPRCAVCGDFGSDYCRVPYVSHAVVEMARWGVIF